MDLELGNRLTKFSSAKSQLASYTDRKPGICAPSSAAIGAKATRRRAMPGCTRITASERDNEFPIDLDTRSFGRCCSQRATQPPMPGRLARSQCPVRRVARPPKRGESGASASDTSAAARRSMSPPSCVGRGDQRAGKASQLEGQEQPPDPDGAWRRSRHVPTHPNFSTLCSPRSCLPK
jgi:hypothetical protein